MEISEEIISKARNMVGDQLDKWHSDINSAFSENDEILDVGFKIRFSMNKGKFKIQSDITFTAEKIKDKQTVWYDPHQPELFTDEEPMPDTTLEG